MQNVGIVFVKMGQYSDAITSFEHIMSEAPSFKTGFNLILCYFALGDRDKMKRAFMKLLTVDLKIDDEDKYLPHGVCILEFLLDCDVIMPLKLSLLHTDFEKRRMVVRPIYFPRIDGRIPSPVTVENN